MASRSLLRAARPLTGLRAPTIAHLARIFSSAAVHEITPTNKELLTAQIGRNYRMEMQLPTFILPEDHGPPHAVRMAEMPSTYTRATLLEDLTDADVGKWYMCRQQDLDLTPPSLKHSFRELFEACMSEYVMIRQPTFDVLQALKEAETGGEAAGKSIGLHGPRGCGKSVSLGLLAQYAVQRDWLVIGLKAEDVAGDKFGFIQPCEERPGTFKQDKYSREWCKLLMTEQGEKLKQIKLKRNYDHYTWKCPEYGPEALGLQCETTETVWDLCYQAAINTSTATNVVYDIVEELKLEKDVKVLVLMDNINVWDQQSRFRDPENPFKSIAPKQLSMVNALSYFMTTGPASGLSVWSLACSGYATLTQSNVHLANVDFAVRNDIYSDDELVSAVTHFKASNLITSDVDQFLLARMKGLTGNVPKDVFFDAVLI